MCFSRKQHNSTVIELPIINMIQKFKSFFSILNSFLLRLWLLKEGLLQKVPRLNEVESGGGGGDAPQGGGFDVGGLNTNLRR